MPASKKYSRKKCPKGSISRNSYTYIRKSTGKKISVKSSCVKSKGLRSQGKKTKRVLPQLNKGSLTKYGYSTKLSDEERQKTLNKALKVYGYSSVVKKLNAVKLLTKNTDPKRSKIYSKDLTYVQKNNKKKSTKKSTK